MNINKEHRALKRKVNRRMMKKREQAIAKAKAAAALLEAIPVYTDEDAARDAALLNALGKGNSCNYRYLRNTASSPVIMPIIS